MKKDREENGGPVGEGSVIDRLRKGVGDPLGRMADMLGDFGKPGTGQQLQERLERSEKELLSRSETLKWLATQPLFFAVVVAVRHATGTEPLVFDGVQRVVEGKRKGEYGLLVSSTAEDVTVKFEDGETEVFKPDQVVPLGTPAGLAVISFQDRLVQVLLPPGLDVKPGDTVSVNGKTLQIVGIVDTKFAGQICRVLNVLDADRCEVEYTNTTRVVYSGLFSGKVGKNDRVVLDPSAVVVVGVLGKDASFRPRRVEKVTWNDLGGLEEVKATLRGVFEEPFTHEALYRAYNWEFPKGILLYGPPRTGKGSLVKAIYNSITTLHNIDPEDCGMFVVKSTELLQMFVGTGEQRLRDVFAQAREFEEKYKIPAVIAIDEVDAIGKKRGTNFGSDAPEKLLMTLMMEMDGLEKSNTIVVLLTNRPDILDQALVSHGRITLHVYVPRPDKKAAEDIFRIYFGKKQAPFASGLDVQKAAAFATESLFSDKHVLYEVTRASSQEVVKFTLGHICNGAMIKDVVNEAVAKAIQRDKAAYAAAAGKGNKFTPSGVSEQDILGVIENVYNGALRMDTDSDIKDFVRNFAKDVKSVRKVYQVHGK